MAYKYFYRGTTKENLSLMSNWKSSSQFRTKVKGVVVHDAASGMTATAKSIAQYTLNSMNSANYHNSIDNTTSCYAVVQEQYAAYHTANEDGNENYIGIEIAPSLTGGGFASQSDIDKHYNAFLEACKLAADYLVAYGLNENNVRLHQSFSSTACPYSCIKNPKIGNGSASKALSEMKRHIKEYISTIKNTTPSNETIWYGKVVQYFKDLRYCDPSIDDRFLIELTATRGIYKNKECTIKDTAPDMKSGDRYIGKSMGWQGKYWVHEFISNNNQPYYIVYGMKP